MKLHKIIQALECDEPLIKEGLIKQLIIDLKREVNDRLEYSHTSLMYIYDGYYSTEKQRDRLEESRLEEQLYISNIEECLLILMLEVDQLKLSNGRIHEDIEQVDKKIQILEDYQSVLIKKIAELDKKLKDK